MAITKINTPELFDLGATNSSLQLPSGNTASRPTNPSTGEWRYNTDDNKVEYWDGADWFQIEYEIPPFTPTENFQTVTYTGNGSTQTVDSKFDMAANFNGSSSYIDTNYTLPSDSTMSFSFWINVASIGSNDEYILSDLSSSGTDRRLDLRFKGSTGGQLYIDIGDGSSNYTTGNTSFVPTFNTWYHIVVTLNGTAINVYIDNGSPISLTSSVAFGTAGARSLSLGRAGDYMEHILKAK